MPFEVDKTSTEYAAGYAEGYADKELREKYKWGGSEYGTGSGANYRTGYYHGVSKKVEEVRQAKPIALDSLAWYEANVGLMSVRVANIVKGEIDYYKPTLRELMARTDAEWLRCPNFGRKSLKELREIIVRSDAPTEADLQQECVRLKGAAERLEYQAKVLRAAARTIEEAIDGKRTAHENRTTEDIAGPTDRGG